MRNNMWLMLYVLGFVVFTTDATECSQLQPNATNCNKTSPVLQMKSPTFPEPGPQHCFTCEQNLDQVPKVTHCKDGITPISVQCPDDLPTCWSMANLTDKSFYLGCGPEPEGKLDSNKIYKSHLKKPLIVVVRCFHKNCNKLINREYIDALLGKPDDLEIDDVKHLNNSNRYANEIRSLNFSEIPSQNRSFSSTPPLNVSSGPIAIVLNTNVKKKETKDLPKAEPLKQQPVPSDDDEDESEGSGTSEDIKTYRKPSSDPSSFLPDEQNRGLRVDQSIVFIGFTLMTFVYL